MIRSHEAFEQQGEFLRTTCELGYLVLAVHLCVGRDISRRYAEYGAVSAADHRCVGDRPLDQIVLGGGRVGTNQQRDFGAVSKHTLDDPLVCLPCFCSKGLQPEGVADTFDDGRLSGAPTSDKSVQVLVESKADTV